MVWKLFLSAALVHTSSAFLSSPNTLRISVRQHTCSSVRMAYVPDGLTAEQYANLKKKEIAKKQANLARVGQNRFKSRSMEAFQKALESGETSHLYPVDPNLYKKGKIKYEDIPYMQRPGGSWDNSDVKGAKRQKRNKSDVAYENGGYKKEQSVSIFGGDNMAWSNFGKKSGTVQFGDQSRKLDERGMDQRKKKFMKKYGAADKSQAESKPKKKSGCSIQ